MCQLVTDEQVVLRRRRAWKVFAGTPTKPLGVYYTPEGLDRDMRAGPGALYKLGKVYSAIPRLNSASSTSGGFHVFTTRKSAEDYRKGLRDWVAGRIAGRMYILQVRVWGRALPFTTASGHKGWAVENLLIPSR